jgi:hypothetical protein
VIDVDDIRHLIVAGHSAPWDGQEGRLQQQIGVENACDLANRLWRARFEVVLSDVATATTIELYRLLLPRVAVVQLLLPLKEARQRAHTAQCI